MSNTDPIKKRGMGTERAIKERRSRDTGNIWHKTRDEDKQTKPITQNAKMWVNPCAHDG